MLNPIVPIFGFLVLVVAIDAARWVYVAKQDPKDRHHSVRNLLVEWWFDRVMDFFR